MIVTPDASVLLKWVLPGESEQDTDEALANAVTESLLAQLGSLRLPGILLPSLDGHRQVTSRCRQRAGGELAEGAGIAVTDTVTGKSKTYRNEAGSICGEVDAGAFR